ncbi:MAG: hypothetical protein QM756_38905 [Polyangiaceae bacterium]
MDASGNALWLSIRYRSVAPRALEAVMRALHSGLRYVCGELEHGSRGFRLTPFGLFGENWMVVPDLATEGDPLLASGAPVRLRDPLDALLSRAESALEELCNSGLSRATKPSLERLHGAALAHEQAGLLGLSTRLLALEAALQGRAEQACDAWFDAALRFNLLREASLD